MLSDGRPPKILILGEARAVHAQRWAEYFSRQGWTVRWFSFPPIPDGVAAEALDDSGLPKVLRILRAVGRVRALAAAFRPDIVSALFVPDYGWLATLARLRPLAVSAWGSDVLIGPGKSLLHRRRIRSVLQQADYLFADAEILRTRMEELGARSETIGIIPLGVDDAWLEAGQRRSQSDSDKITVVCNRRQEALYQVDVFVRAAIRLAHEQPDRFRFVVIGNGSLHEDLVKQTQVGDAGDAIVFRDWLDPDALRTEFSQADIYVSPSSSDGTSVSLLEAMAAGCYPIVTAIPGNREWITSGDNGTLFPVGDVDALVQALRDAAADRAMRHAAQTVNRDLVTQRALWRNNMGDVARCMLDVISRYPQVHQSTGTP
ncbi:MAG TPA: glycosyltransferase family 4 protein [candidate division Zixibacteria bacterium]|nr:glycosyltransferase family 4 protein [candidate division Zixibacteria bacterium]